MIEKYDEVREVDEIRYKEKILKDAIDENGSPVRVVDDRRTSIFTEAQIDAQLAEAQATVDRIQAKKDSITTIKAA